jgi:Uma2 family endonuclease
MAVPATRTGLPITQAEFEEWSAACDTIDDNHYEFLYGCVVAEPPARWPHGKIDGSMTYRLAAHVEARGLGLVLGSSQGFALPSGDTVQPDTAVILNDTWAAAPPPVRNRFLTIVPDVVVEILSPSTARVDLRVKRDIYERNGVREYRIVDPPRRAVTVLVAGADGRFTAERIAVGDEPACSTLLPGFAVRPSDLIP